MGRTDERGDATAGTRDLLERSLGRTDEAGTKQEIFGRIAGDDQLGEEDHVDALPLRLFDAVQNPRGVSFEIADDGVDLRQRKPHALSLRLRSENSEMR